MSSLDPELKDEYQAEKYRQLLIPGQIKTIILRDESFNSLIPLSFFEEQIKYIDYNDDGFMDIGFIAKDTVTNEHSLIMCAYGEEQCHIIQFRELGISHPINWEVNNENRELTLFSSDPSTVSLSWNENMRFFNYNVSIE